MNRLVSNKECKQVTFIADLVVSGVILFFMTQTLDSFNYPKVVAAAVGIIALALTVIVYFGYPLRTKGLHPIEYILFLIIALIVGLASQNNISSFTTIWGSFSRANGIITKIALLILVIIYLRFSNAETIDRFFRVAAVLLSIEIAYGAIQLTGNDPIPWINPYNNIFVTTGNPNFASALFAILVVINFKFLFSKNVFWKKMVFSILILAGVYMSYATKSVQGILTILASIFLLSIITMLRFIVSKRYVVLLISGAVFFSLPVALGVFNIGPLKAFLFQETLSIRMHYWRVALRMMENNLFSGVGIDRYGDYYRLYREANFVEKYSPGLVSTNAHNVALQWGTDLGLLGTFVYISLYLVPLFVYLRKSKFSVKRNLTNYDYLFVAYSAFYLQSLISISQMAISILGFCLLGLCLSQVFEDEKSTTEKPSPNRNSTRRRKSNFIGIGTWWLVFSLAIAPLLIQPIKNDLALRKALQAPGGSQGVSDLGPRSKTIYSATLPFIVDQDYLGNSIQNLFANGNAQTGVELAKLAIQRNPMSWVAYRSLFDAYSQSNMHTESIAVMKELLEIDPLNYNLYFEMSQEALKSGDVKLATQFANRTLEAAPESSEAYLGATKILKELGR